MLRGRRIKFSKLFELVYGPIAVAVVYECSELSKRKLKTEFVMEFVFSVFRGKQGKLFLGFSQNKYQHSN
jgi:hypothetical protein